jgi:hypothetical protein
MNLVNPRLPLRLIVQAMWLRSSTLITSCSSPTITTPPLPSPPPHALLKRSISGAFNNALVLATVAGDPASTTLGDILQYDAVMCQSKHCTYGYIRHENRAYPHTQGQVRW